jgi:hypothetical protein
MSLTFLKLMSTARLLTSPLWFPFWLVWNVLSVVGRTIWIVVTVSLKLAVVLLAIFGLLVWVWW